MSLPEPPNYWTRLDRSCSPLSMVQFRILKSVFYTAVVGVILLGVLRESAIDPTLAFGLAVFLIITIVTEVKEIEIGAGAASITATFNGDYEDDEESDGPDND